MVARGTIAGLGAVVAFLALAAGSCDEKGLGDAPVGDAIEDERLVIVMPDSFPNFAILCDGTTAIYAHTRQAAPVTVAESTLCDGRGVDANQVDEGRSLSESELDDLDGSG